MQSRIEDGKHMMKAASKACLGLWVYFRVARAELEATKVAPVSRSKRQKQRRNAERSKEEKQQQMQSRIQGGKHVMKVARTHQTKGIQLQLRNACLEFWVYFRVARAVSLRLALFRLALRVLKVAPTLAILLPMQACKAWTRTRTEAV